MKKINVAILDMNEGMPNQGMRCIRDLLENLKNNNIGADDFNKLDNLLDFH